MGGQKSQGFTIIETLLFLSISGLMMVTMIAGTSAALNAQRYQDSVRSLKSLLQEQYAKISSIENERPDATQCGADGTSLPKADPLDQKGRGQSKCEIFGRFVLIQDNVVTTFPLLVYRNELSKPENASDVELMSNAAYSKISVDASNVETKNLEWGARIAWPESGSGARSPTMPRTISLLFVRSPESGLFYTFTGNDAPSDMANVTQAYLQSMMIAGDGIPGQGGRTLCIDSDGLVMINDKHIYINPAATGPSSIEARTNDYNSGVGRDTRC